MSSVQKFLGKRTIASALKKRREKKIFNIHTAKIMGIVFPVTDSWDMKILDQFTQEVKKHNIKVYSIGWVNAKELPEKLKETEFLTFLIKKDLNFLGMPVSSEKFRNFTNRKYDILIDFSFQPNIITSIISARADAKMKISRDLDETKSIYDFLIKTDDSIKQNTFFEQVTYYLNTINISQ